MKNYYKTLLVLSLLSSLVGCSVKSTNSKLTTTSSTSPIGTSTPTPTVTSTTGPITSCDGVYRDGATRCYYKNIPTVMASGGSYGMNWWSSETFISTSGNSPGQFSTDATFNVRIIPRSPTANATSTFNKTCSPYMMYASKLKIQLMMRKSGVSLGEVATLTAPLNTASSVWNFTVPATSSPLILEVVNVSSDSRCKPKPGSTTQSYYGSIPASCASNPYLDIPVNTAGSLTECVAFDIQYSTDETYDLPGSSAN